MEDVIHQSAASYALDALSDEEVEAYEAHLAVCPQCQEEVAAFSDVGAALAFAPRQHEPPSALRERVLSAARQDQPNVVVLRPRWAYPALAAAAVAACLAIGFGVWAATFSTHAQKLEALPLQGATGSLILTHGGDAALVVSGMRPAPSGKTYEVWVIHGKSASPAGLFTAASRSATVHLTRSVPAGSFVGVTLERAGGASHPSGRPLFRSAPA